MATSAAQALRTLLFDLPWRHEAADAVLGEACRLRGHPDLADEPQGPDWQRFKDGPRYLRLRELLENLLAQPRSDVLRALVGLQDAERSAAFWIQPTAAEEVARLARGWGSVRLAFDGAVLPALAIGADAAEAGRPVRLRLVCRSLDASLRARRLAAVLDVALDVVEADPLSRIEGEGAFDGEVSIPPFGARVDDSSAVHPATLRARGAAASKRVSMEALAMTDLVVHAEGEALVLLPEATLTRMVGAETAVREDLVRSGRVRAVLAASGGLLAPNTLIRCAVLCLGRRDEHHERVRMVDLGHEALAVREARGRVAARNGVAWDDLLSQAETDPAWGRDVPAEEVAAQGFALAPERFLSVGRGGALDAFLASEGTMTLGEVAEIVRPIALRRAEEGVEVHDASPGDVGADGLLGRPGRVLLVGPGDMRAVRGQRIREDDVLLSIRGTIGTVGLARGAGGLPNEDADGAIWTAGQAFVILRPRRQGVHPVVLHEFLSSDAARERLKVLASGSGVQSVAAADIRDFRVPVPPPDEQAQVVAAFEARQELHREAGRLLRRAAEMRAASWPHRDLGAQGSLDLGQDDEP